MCFHDTTDKARDTCNTSDVEMKSDYLWHALQMLKDPKVLEAIASISTTPKPNVPVDHGQVEFENLKHEEDKEKFFSCLK